MPRVDFAHASRLSRRIRIFSVVGNLPTVRHAALLALKEKKFRVHSLAAAIRCSDRHLEKCWAHMRGELGRDGDLPPNSFKKFLDRLLLLHALRDWLAGPSQQARWNRIAQGLGVTEETVRNQMCGVLNVEPSSVEISNVVSLVSQLESELLSPFE